MRASMVASRPRAFSHLRGHLRVPRFARRAKKKERLLECAKGQDEANPVF